MPYKVKGKCVYKKDGGAKVGCTKGSVKKYLAALHANASESTQELIRRLIRENLGLFLVDEAPDTTTFDITSGKRPIGSIVIGQANKDFGRNTLEIIDIRLSNDVNHLDAGRKTLLELFEKYPDIERIVMKPKMESVDFWTKLDAQRINDIYMIILRAH